MRFNPSSARPKVYQALFGVSRELGEGSLERSIRCLVEIRVSQINGCGYCSAMHSQWARDVGVPQAKLDTLPGWREDDGYSERERAALALAEAVNSIPAGLVGDDVWRKAREEFSDEDLGDLIYAIGLIGLYNRVNVAVEFSANLWREQGLAGLR
jgi:uncharacterized peroxidase-related enzyme